ncbi:hypothetical protein ACFLTQ_00130 [Chloroflexota bacterium]
MSDTEQTSTLTTQHLNLLEYIVGREWLDRSLTEYSIFRERFSLLSRWWHRFPDVSPIVPLIYWAQPGPRYELDKPFGMWQGDPSGILYRLIAAIVEFQDYWQILPNNIGLKNLQDKLYSSKRFYGFRHEISLATHLKNWGYNIEPYFFNPSVEKGSADIIVKDGNKTYDVQCKARNPSAAYALPYEAFLYFAGRWARLVSDSGMSYSLILKLRKKVNQSRIDQLLDSLALLLSENSIPSRNTKNDFWDAEILEIGYGSEQTAPESLADLTLSRSGVMLYSDMELLRPRSENIPPLVSDCRIIVPRRPEIEDHIFSTAEHAAAAHSGVNPLIISVNLYQEMDISEYLNSPKVVPRYYSWCSRFFSKYPSVAMLLFSTGYDKYFQRDEPHFALGKKYLVVESPNFENVLPNVR